MVYVRSNQAKELSLQYTRRSNTASLVVRPGDILAERIPSSRVLEKTTPARSALPLQEREKQYGHDHKQTLITAKLPKQTLSRDSGNLIVQGTGASCGS